MKMEIHHPRILPHLKVNGVIMAVPERQCILSWASPSSGVTHCSVVKPGSLPLSAITTCVIIDETNTK